MRSIVHGFWFAWTVGVGLQYTRRNEQNKYYPPMMNCLVSNIYHMPEVYSLHPNPQLKQIWLFCHLRHSAYLDLIINAEPIDAGCIPK